MRRFPRLLFLLVAVPLLAACSGGHTFVVVDRLARPAGESATISPYEFDVVVHVQADCTSFHPVDLMHLVVNGTDMTDQAVCGGNWAVLPLSPPPLGSNYVELSRRLGPVIDHFTFDVQPYAGPTLASVSPDTAQVGTQVTITGAGFAAGALRVFFGGVEGTVDSSSDTSISATVPANALPGLVYVLVGDEAAEGVVGFQPEDASSNPIPFPTGLRIFGAFPATSKAERAIRVYGVNFTVDDHPVFSGNDASRLFGVKTVTVMPIGDIRFAYGVPYAVAPKGTGTVALKDPNNNTSNALPHTVQ